MGAYEIGSIHVLSETKKKHTHLDKDELESERGREKSHRQGVRSQRERGGEGEGGMLSEIDV